MWRSEKRDGKPTKIPYSPLTGQRASSTTPETWAGYEEAVRSAREHDYGGVGFVFTPADDLCGVDLDGCLDSETGEIESWAQKVIEQLGLLHRNLSKRDRSSCSRERRATGWPQP